MGARLEQADSIKASVKRDIAERDSQLDGLLDRMVETNSEAVVAAYEKKITKLEQVKLVPVDKLDQKAHPMHTPEEISELSMAFLSIPSNIWKTANSRSRKQS